MHRLKRRSLVILGTLTLLFTLLVIVASFVIHTSMFSNAIRTRLISDIQAETGGRVELRRFSFNWHTFTANLRGLIIHGTEPAGAPPLLSFPDLQIKLKLTSLLKSDIDVIEVIAQRPTANLLVRSDGRTNIPVLSGQSPLGRLISLQVRRYALDGGTVNVNGESHAFDIRGENLRLRLALESSRPVYAASLSSDRISARATCCRELPLSLNLEATLGGSGIDVNRLTLQSSASNLQARGVITDLEHPVADLDFLSRIDAREAAARVDLDAAVDGILLLRGKAHYDRSGGFSAAGTLDGQHLRYRSRQFGVSDVSVNSRFRASGSDLVFSDLTAGALGGSFKGQVDLQKLTSLKASGALNAVDLKQLAASVGLKQKSFPWSGAVSGGVSLLAQAGPVLRLSDFRGDLDIHPRSGAVPVSGHLAVTRSRNAVFNFGPSHLDLPSTVLSFSGSTASEFQVNLNTTNVADLVPALHYANVNLETASLLRILPGGSASFSGTVVGLLATPSLAGALHLSKFYLKDHNFDALDWKGSLRSDLIDTSALVLRSGGLAFSGSGQVGLRSWQFSDRSPVSVEASFDRLDIPLVLAALHLGRQPVEGFASGKVALSGSLANPSGHGHVVFDDPVLRGQRFKRVEADISLSSGQLAFANGKLAGAAGGAAAFSGSYLRSGADWENGRLALAFETARFPLGNIALVSARAPGLSGQLDVHAHILAGVSRVALTPLALDGTLALHHLEAGGVHLGGVTGTAATRAQQIQLDLNGHLRESAVQGTANISLLGSNETTGEFHFEQLSIATLSSLAAAAKLPLLHAEGSLSGQVILAGPLQDVSLWHSTLRVNDLHLRPSLPSGTVPATAAAALELHNQRPIVLELSGRTATVRSFDLLGPDTRVNASGTVGYLGQHPVDLTVEGSVNLQLLQIADADLQSSGQSSLHAAITGTLLSPVVKGSLALTNGSFSLRDSFGGLTSVNGSVSFDNSRATIQTLTAQSGGGLLKVGGFVSFGGAGPLVYHLNASADDVRLRYARSISVTGNADLRLTGTSSSSLLSGTTSISRVVFTPTTDVGNVLANFAAPTPTPANQSSFLTGLHLDIGIESAPDLQLSTALSRDVEAGIDLRLRGTPDRPILLGSVSANQGDIRVFGARYSINRGEIRFSNPNKIDPVLDLDLQTQARGIAVDITISGTLNRLNLTYRSDPPLQPRDIIALLTVGRTPESAANVQDVQVASDSTIALQAGASTVLGQAITPPNNRLSKLFGITNVKIDPLVQGITNTPQSRLTLEQQVSRDITITYVTNLDQTSEQIFRLEWAFNRQFSVVAVRDDNGEFGIDFQYKKRFK